MILRLIALSFLVGCAGVYYWSWNATQSDAVSVIGQPFPTITLPQLNDKTQPEGTAMLINVFASWCTPCIAELPYLQQIREQSGVKVIGIAWNDKAENLTPWLEKHGDPFDVIYLDSRGEIPALLGVTGLPESFVVNQQGLISNRHRGAITAEHVPEYVRRMRELLTSAAKPE